MKQANWLLSISRRLSTVLATSNCYVSKSMGGGKHLPPKWGFLFQSQLPSPCRLSNRDAQARLTKTRPTPGPCFTPFPIGYESDKIPSTKHSARKQDHGNPSRATCLPQPGPSPPDSICYNLRDGAHWNSTESALEPGGGQPREVCSVWKFPSSFSGSLKPWGKEGLQDSKEKFHFPFPRPQPFHSKHSPAGWSHFMNVGLLGLIQRLATIFLRLKKKKMHTRNLAYMLSFVCPEEINIPVWGYLLWFTYTLRHSCFIL